MPYRTPVHRQSFRVYDATTPRPQPASDTGFELVVAAKREPDLVEHALAHLRYVRTDVGVDWIDVVEMVGARCHPAYGVADVTPGCDGHQIALREMVAAAQGDGREAFVFVQLVAVEDRPDYTLERLDADTTALFNLGCVDLVFTSTVSPRESHAVVVGFDRSKSTSARLPWTPRHFTKSMKTWDSSTAMLLR